MQAGQPPGGVAVGAIGRAQLVADQLPPHRQHDQAPRRGFVTQAGPVEGLPGRRPAGASRVVGAGAAQPGATHLDVDHLGAGVAQDCVTRRAVPADPVDRAGAARKPAG